MEDFLSLLGVFGVLILTGVFLFFAVWGIGYMIGSENYSVGERVGYITQFSKTGVFWKSYEGHLNMTQTGMNSSQQFDFSIDNKNPNPVAVNQILSALTNGQKVMLHYHEVWGRNIFEMRGETNYFVDSCEVMP